MEFHQYETGEAELYDLQRDPYELENLIKPRRSRISPH